MTEIDPTYHPKIEQSPRWFFVGRVAATGLVKATMRLETDDRRTGSRVTPATVIAPNHQSNIDPFTSAVASYENGFGQIAFLAKEQITNPAGSRVPEGDELWKKLVAQAARVVDFAPSQALQRIAAHPTKRGGNADKDDINNWAVHEMTRMGVSVESFPEGTRNKRGDDLLPLKTGTAHMSIYSGRPITPVGNAGTRDIRLGHRRENVVVNVFTDPMHPDDYISRADIGDAEIVKRAAGDMTADLQMLLQEAYEEALDHRAFLLSRND